MDYGIIAIVSFLVAVLTFFSGFGLGTLLMPVFALFFTLEVAIGATAIVHLANNVLKLGLVGKHAAWPVVLRFGVPAVGAAFLGAYLLSGMSGFEPLLVYQMGNHLKSITYIGLVIAILITVFALIDLLPFFERFKFKRRLLPLGGLLSGFFGGLSGHQGALRSAFLVKWGLSKEAFIGTGVVCAVAVDCARLLTYGSTILKSDGAGFEDVRLVWMLITAILAAFLGSFIGAKLLHKVTIQIICRLVGFLLLFLAASIGSGLI